MAMMGAVDPLRYSHSYLRKARLTASALLAVAPLPALSGVTPVAERVTLVIGSNDDAPASESANPGSAAAMPPFAFGASALVRLQPTGLSGDSGWLPRARRDLVAG